MRLFWGRNGYWALWETTFSVQGSNFSWDSFCIETLNWWMSNTITVQWPESRYRVFSHDYLSPLSWLLNMNDKLVSLQMNNSCHMYLFISFPGDTKKCMDLDNNCDYHVPEEDKRQCQRQPDYMMQNCKRSCDFCGPGRNKSAILISYGHDHVTTHLFHLIRYIRYSPSLW